MPPGTGNRVNPRAPSQRSTLRAFGWLLVCAGAPLTIIGLVSFFTSFNNPGTAGMPQYFWCAFIGLPLVAIGVRLLKIGYLGSIARYVAGETMPVGTDALGQIAEHGKDSVRELARAVGEGLRSRAESEVPCPHCGEGNDPDARFCDDCGAPLGRGAMCAGCGHANDAAARFCNRCGKPLASAAP
jgi:Double zinc ribbon